MKTSVVQRAWGRLIWVFLTNGVVSLLLINGIRSKVELAHIANAGQNASSLWQLALQDPSQWLCITVLFCGLIAEVLRVSLARYLNVGFFLVAALVLAAESLKALIKIKHRTPGYHQGEAGIGLTICVVFITIAIVDIILYTRGGLAQTCSDMH